MLLRRQSEFTTRGLGTARELGHISSVFLWGKEFLRKIWLTYVAVHDLRYNFLRILPLCGLSRLQHEKLVAVQMATSSIMSAWYDPSGITAPIPQQRSTPRRAPAQMANSQNGENILPHGNAPPPCRRPSDPWQKWKTRLKFSASTTCVGLPNNRVCLDFCPGRGPGPI